MAFCSSFQLWACCLFYALRVVKTLTDGDDYVPNFFSGRRQGGEHAGIDPPPVVHSKQRALITNVKVMKFTQKLDHFNSTCLKSWTQRYLVNDEYFSRNRSRPIIFIRVGGENSVDKTDLVNGRMVQLAKRHRALLLELEHRYYGESKPTKNLKVENLHFLSHSQALMDLETFIWNQKLPFVVNAQFPSVILYGCSYAGSLAAFHRARYANSSLGALSVCAPMTAEAAGEKHETATEDAIRKVDPACMNNVATAISAIQNSFATKGTLQTKGLQLCEPQLQRPVDVESLEYQTFYYELSYRMLQAAQYNRMGLGEQSELGLFCQTMNDESVGVPAERYVTWLNSTGRKCLKHDGLSILSRTAYWNSTLARSGTRQWLYQMCTEFGYFSGFLRVWKHVWVRPMAGGRGKRNAHMLKGWGSPGRITVGDSMDVQIVQKICTDSFGIIDTVASQVPKTKAMLNEAIREASKTVFIQGQMDPWRALGVSDYLLHTEYNNYLSSVFGYAYGENLSNVLADLGKEASAEQRRAVRDLVLKFPANASHCEEPSGDLSNYPDLVEAYESAEAKITEWLSGRWNETFKKPIN